MIIRAGVICTSVHLYMIIMCTDGVSGYVSMYAIGIKCSDCCMPIYVDIS